jgi:hypothetical protein
MQTGHYIQVFGFVLPTGFPYKNVSSGETVVVLLVHVLSSTAWRGLWRRRRWHTFGCRQIKEDGRAFLAWTGMAVSEAINDLGERRRRGGKRKVYFVFEIYDSEPSG